MGIALMIIGALIAGLGLLALVSTISSTIASVASLLVCLIGVVLIAGGAIVQTINHQAYLLERRSRVK